MFVWWFFFYHNCGLYEQYKVAECNLQKHLSETLVESIMKDICNTPNEQHPYDILYFLPVEK